MSTIKVITETTITTYEAEVGDHYDFLETEFEGNYDVLEVEIDGIPYSNDPIGWVAI